MRMRGPGSHSQKSERRALRALIGCSSAPVGERGVAGGVAGGGAATRRGAAAERERRR